MTEPEFGFSAAPADAAAARREAAAHPLAVPLPPLPFPPPPPPPVANPLGPGTNAHCTPCPLYKTPPEEKVCRGCGRGRNWWNVLPLLALAGLFTLLLRFTAMVLGGEMFSLQRDFEAREGQPFLRIEPLARYCAFPISIFEYPAQLHVLGGLLAGTILVPLVVARLHGRAAGLAFLALAVAVGSFPWLALALLPGVWLMSSSWRFAAKSLPALVAALLPVVAYTLLTVDAVRDMPSKTPIHRWAAYFPSLLAVPGAVGVGWLLLTGARLARHRVTATVPAIAVVCAIPAAVFFLAVGRSELDFALLRQYHDPKVRFDVIPGRDRIVEHLRKRGVQDFEDWWDDDVAIEELDASQIKALLLRRMKRETVHRCLQFVKSFPDSPHAPDALYYGAQTLDMTFDEAKFRAGGVIRFDSAATTAQGLHIWRQLVQSYPEHPLMVVAEFRLALYCMTEAEAALKAGDLQTANEKANEALARFNHLPAERERFQSAESAKNESALTQLLASFGFNPAPSYPALLTGVAAEADIVRDSALCDLFGRIEAAR